MLDIFSNSDFSYFHSSFVIQAFLFILPIDFFSFYRCMLYHFFRSDFRFFFLRLFNFNTPLQQNHMTECQGLVFCCNGKWENEECGKLIANSKTWIQYTPRGDRRKHWPRRNSEYVIFDDLLYFDQCILNNSKKAIRPEEYIFISCFLSCLVVIFFSAWYHFVSPTLLSHWSHNCRTRKKMFNHKDYYLYHTKQCFQSSYYTRHPIASNYVFNDINILGYCFQ